PEEDIEQRHGPQLGDELLRAAVHESQQKDDSGDGEHQAVRLSSGGEGALRPTTSILTTISLGMLVTTTGGGWPAFDYSKEPDPRKREFVLGTSDQVRINVWKNPKLSTDARVRPDGTITMPLIGDLPAAGRTPSELQKEITAKLSSYVREGAAV